jgi:hypothetical protein
MQVSPNNPKLVVTSASTFWKAKEAVESEVALGEFAELKHDLGDKVEIGSTTYREATGQKLKRKAWGVVKKLPYILLGAGALGITAASAGLLTPLAAVGMAAAASGGLALASVSPALKDAVSQSKIDVELPPGLAAQHTGSEPLEFENLQDTSGPGDGLREMTIANMKQFPSAMHVVHLNGHGHGAKAVAGLTGRDAQESMKEAVGQTGQKYGVAFYETCFGANWENLHNQAEVAEYAVAFEDMIPKSNSKVGRLNLNEVLSTAVDAENPRRAAQQMAQAAGAHFDSRPAPISNVPFTQRETAEYRTETWTNTDSTAVAVDLKTLREKLSPSLDELGKNLTNALKADKTLARAAREARKENLIERGGDLVDMGGFLTSLRENLTDTSSKKSLDNTLKTLDSVLLHKRTGKDLPLSGLSFHSKPDTMNFSNPASPAHESKSLPQGWIEFVDQAFEGSPLQDIFAR